MGKTNWLLAIGIGVIAIWFIAPQTFDFILGAEDKETTTTVGACPNEDISFTPSMTRVGKAGTTVTDNYYILTDKIGSVNSGTATTVPVNSPIEVMYGENSTTYYTKVVTESILCKDPFYASPELYYADTSLSSFYIENTDGTVNSATNNESMGASEVVDMTVCIKASSDEYFGNPDSDCQNVAVVEYDKTYILSVTGDTPLATPGTHTFSNTRYDGTGSFEIPKVGDGQKECFNVKVETTTTEPPTSILPILNISILDCDIDKDEDSLAILKGVEDEDLNLLSLARQNLAINTQ